MVRRVAQEPGFGSVRRYSPRVGRHAHREGMGVDSADDLSSLSFREVLKEAGISTNYDNCSSLGRKLAEYVTVVKDFP